MSTVWSDLVLQASWPGGPADTVGVEGRPWSSMKDL